MVGFSFIFHSLGGFLESLESLNSLESLESGRILTSQKKNPFSEPDEGLKSAKNFAKKFAVFSPPSCKMFA